ncbi:MAG: hypothetical protein H7222_11330 [Methylotenera sp.]|nr:hypothetical protein [Oligoflexia bacterium]
MIDFLILSQNLHDRLKRKALMGSVLLSVLFSFMSGPAEAAAAPSRPTTPDNRPVTQDQLKALIKHYKTTLQRLEKVEKQAKSGGSTSSGAEEAVDLGATNVAATPTDPAKFHGGSATGSHPDFKVYFDLDLISRPGYSNFTFDNYHSYLLFEFVPSPTVQFTFDVRETPRYYELDLQATPRLQVRLGKIWIPFDDMAPHNIFGGRVNVSRLSPGTGPVFLPDLWTDLGVGLKYKWFDTPKFALDTHLYVVNGFRDGGKDPTGATTPYPSFSDLPTSADNNRAKAIGGRVAAKVGSRLGLGFSYYSNRWNSQDNPLSQTMSILGFDTQLRLGRGTEFRFGLAKMSVNTVSGPFTRGGYYGEVGQKLGAEQKWKVLGRLGQVQVDDRVLDPNDVRIIGATVLYKPNLIEYSIEHSKDLEMRSAKKGYSYTAARVIIAF